MAIKIFIIFAKRIPAIVANMNEISPRINIPIVSHLRKTLAGIVEPTAKPRKIIVTFIREFSDTSASLGTTPLTFIKLPNISMPINAEADGTKILIINILIIGK